jgi:hypothetical protein
VVETREVKKRLERSRSLLPDLVESDGESDEEDSCCEDPQFESGGDEGASVKRDMWADHPARKLDDEFEFEAQTPAQAPEKAPVDPAPDLGRSVDGKSRQLCGQYLCSMGKKQYHQESGRLLFSGESVGSVASIASGWQSADSRQML